ncbi:DUF5118 domain-containing protein, partial [Flavobacteriaceae bacterium]|nr:DUF5118 domain-containing protein [Flavobacteriaceae bacterium]
MKQIIFLLTLVLSLSVTAQKKEKSNQLKSIDSLTTKMAQKRGIITTYLNEENKLFFEMDESVLNKDLLVVTRIAQLPANYSAYLNAGSKTAEQVLRFSKKGKKIILKQVGYANIADQGDPIA